MKSKKKMIILIAVLVLVVCGGTVAGIMIWKNKSNNVSEGTLGKNQSYVYGQIETIAGNDMKLALAEAVTEERTNNKGSNSGNRPNRGNRGSSGSESSGSTDANSGASVKQESGISQQSYKTTTSSSGTSQMPPDAGQMPGGEAPNGQMPPDAGQMPPDVGQMPNGEAPNGQMPGDETSNGQNSSNDANSDSSDKDSSQDTTTVTTYKLTGDKAEYMIPVKTSVTTQLGATTTFMRLAAGDYVKLLMDKDENGNDIILQIWIVG